MQRVTSMHFKTFEDFESNAMRLLSDDASRVSCVALHFAARALNIAIPSAFSFFRFRSFHVGCFALLIPLFDSAFHRPD